MLPSWPAIQPNMGILLTMDDEQGVKLVQLVKPQVVIPIHYNDYGVFKLPLKDLKKRIEADGLSQIVTYLAHGESYRWHIPESRLA